MAQKLRIRRIEIDNPPNVGEIWIRVEIELITVDDQGNVVQVNPMNKYIMRQLSSFMMETYSYDDMVLH